MHTSTIGRKGKLAALLAAFAVVVGGAFSPLTPNAIADQTTANSWSDIQQQINSASGARTITLGSDMTYDGTPITIPSGKNITIVGDKTIYRDSSAASLDSMFKVSGTLTIGDKVKLSGKKAACSAGSTQTPSVTAHPAVTRDVTEKHYFKRTQRGVDLNNFKNLEGTSIVLGFYGLNGKEWMARINGDQLVLKAASDVVTYDSGDTKGARFKTDVNTDDYWFTVTNVDNDSYAAAYLMAANGKALGRPGNSAFDPVGLVSPSVGESGGYRKVEFDAGNQVFKFSMPGLDTLTEKFIFPRNGNNPKNFVEGDKVVIGSWSRLSNQLGSEMSFYWYELPYTYWMVNYEDSDPVTDAVRDTVYETESEARQAAIIEPAYWSVEGTDQKFTSEAAANQWASAHATTTPSECTTSCAAITTAMFNGSAGNEKGYFVQVSSGGTFNLQDNAELRDFITGPNVSHVAPVVAKGGTVNIKGGKITNNSAGYNADDSRNQQDAKKIQTYIEKNLARTETAGGIMYLGGAKGSITGGTIENNRGDTGGVIVRGEGSAVEMTGGAINKNVGVHYGGAAYVHMGGSLVMAGNATMDSNYAWDRGGAVYVSSQDYASSIVWPVIDPKEYKAATFVMDENAVISGNYAVNRAGAVFVESHDVMLKSGQITGNFSRSLGGAIYVVGDGDARMYQLYVPNACVTGNTAVKGGVNAGPLNKALPLPNNTGSTCEVNNTMQSTGLLQGDNVDFRNHEGFGGGVWLCAFGGNATFGSGTDAQGNNANVVVAGNSAQPKQGSDMHLRPTKPGAGSGINVLNNYANRDQWVNEVNGNTIEVNQVYTGPLNVKNNGSAECSGSLKIQGNYARVGGGIASDGTVIFGPAQDIYRVHGQLEVTKTWENVPEDQRKAIDLQLAVKDDTGTHNLEGYKTRLNGKADTYDNENPIEEGDGKYNDETPAWEATAWTGTFGLPLVYTDGNGNEKPVLLFTDPDDTSRTLDPSEADDLPRLYELVKAKRLGNGNLVADLVVIETINGQAPTEYVYSQEDVTFDVDTSANESKTLAEKTYKDRAGNVIGVVTTNKLALNLHKDISNTVPGEEVPQPEKYVNKDVHQDIVNFDQEFTYDIMAYVPTDATSVKISDTLIEGLEFADANGNPTTDPKKAIQRIAFRETNDHTPKGSVSADPNGTLAIQNQNPKIEGDTLSITINGATPLGKVKGKWVQLTFNARIKDAYRSLDSDGNPKGLTKLPGWTTIPSDQNAPVKSTQSHTGMSNAAKYIVAPAHDGVTEYDTNTVTIKPETTQLQVEKKWNNAGETSWPSEVPSVTFGVFAVKGGQETKVQEVELTPSKTSATVTDLPKLKGTTYVAREIKVGDTDVAYGNNTAGVANVSDLVDYIVKTLQETVNDVNKFIAINQEPQVEKYVNNKVHADLEGFDEEFEFAVMGYVPAGATKVTVTDTLTSDLEFVNAAPNKVLSGVRMYKANNHKGDGTGTVSVNSGGDMFWNAGRVAQNNRPADTSVTVSPDGKTVTLTLEESFLNEVRASNALKGTDGSFWVKMSFKAKINPNSYDKVKQQLAAGADPAIDGLNWERITDNGTVLNGDADHAGLLNKASYKVFVGNEGTAEHETNTVTVKPTTETVSATKTWLDENGQVANWPDDVEAVTVNVRANGEGDPVGTLTITKDPATGKATVATSDVLPKLDGVTYTVEEVEIPGYLQASEVTGTGTPDDPYVFTNRKVGGPQIEKYINNGVHENLNAGFDTSFKYDIIAYVPEDADEIVIKDTLVNALEFAKAPADGALSNAQTVAAEASTNPAEVVTGIVVKDTNNHLVGTKYDNATVISTDGTPLGSAAAPTIDGKELTVKIADASAYRGKYIQVTFWAKYTQEMIDAATAGNSRVVNGNGAVLGGMQRHEGTTNDASYDIRVGGDWTYDVKSNTVTVRGTTVQLDAEKYWQNADGSAADWPASVDTVTIKVMNGNVQAVDTEGNPAVITLTADMPKAKSKTLAKLVGVTYTLDEVTVPGYTTEKDGNVFTNRVVGTPQIEKYINKDVDAHLVQFDKVITYDILAFVPRDAEAITITDLLVDSLEFADASGNASLDEAAVVASVVAKDTNDHTAVTGTVASTDGTPLGNAAAISFADEGKRLNVEIADATAYQGKWIQVTFYAKYTDAAIAAAAVSPAADNENVSDNGSVISSIKTHDGTQNTASYTLRINNEWSSAYTSNTVTHDAERERVQIEKIWKNNAGELIEWPAKVKSVKVNVINSKTGATVNTITLDSAHNPRYSKWLPKLTGVTYEVQEASAISGYTSQVDGTTVVNTEKPKHDVIFSKYELGDDTKKLEGAKIKVTDAEGNVVDEWTSSSDGPHVMELQAGEYTFEEVSAPDGFDAITTTVTFTVAEDGTVTLKEAYENIGGKVSVVDTNHLILEDMPTKAEIEKYVNKDVHADIVNFDQYFTYDVLAYVSNNADSAEIYDTLVGDVEFADAAGNATTDASASIASVVVKDTNDHTAATGTVASTDGTPIEYTATIDGSKLTVAVADATAARGKWIQVTFNARIKDENRALADLDQSTITADAPVTTTLDLPSGNKAGNHTGVPNTASYTLFDNENGALDLFRDEDGNEKPKESNTVTVVPETVQIDITKTWLNAEGWAQASPAQWPAGATVTVDIMNGADVVKTVTLDADNQSATVTDLPKLINAAYSVVEREVTGVFSLADETVFEKDADGNVMAAKLVNRLLPKKSEMSIEVAKVDEGGNPLAGAQLEVTDAEGNVVDSWTTDGENRLLPHITPGTYTLSETAAPTGYLVADPITFEVTEAGVVMVDGEEVDAPTITMVDKLKPEKTSPSTPTATQKSAKPGVTARPLVRTGSPAAIALLTAFALLGAGAGLLVVRRRRS